MCVLAGASSVLLDISTPYSRGSTIEYLGGEPIDGYCSAKTSIELAKVLF